MLFRSDKSWVLKEPGLLCIIGHNRWATVGDVNEENAYPFHEKDIVGCHNGTIHNYTMMHLDNHDNKMTDSQILMKEFADGADVSETMKYLGGAWALTWFDTDKRRLHMCRNKERTLYVAKDKEGRTMFWSSEAWMLEVALTRAGVKYEKILPVREEKHLVWKIGKKGEVELEYSEDAVGGVIRSWYNHRDDDRWGTGYLGNSTDLRPAGPATPYSSRSNVVPLRKEEEEYEEEYTEISKNVFIHRRLFEARTKAGCSYCSGDLTWEGRDRITWADAESPLCLDCAEHLTTEGKKGVH